MCPSDILDRVVGALADRAATATDPRVTVGDNLLAVDAIDPEHGRLAGVAHRPDGVVAEMGADIETASVPTLLELATGGGTHLARAVGLATANALSVPDVEWQAGDPMAALSADVGTVATVGFFGPAFRKFDAVEVRVVERDPPESVDAPPGVAVELFDPEDCEAAFTGADLCFVTGSAFIYGGIDRYLSVLSRLGVSPVVLVGATASHRPGPAFEAGVDVVAGARVTDPARVRNAILARDCATDLHGDGLEKVYVTASDSVSGLAL